jgi:DNA-binding transcriptional regulator of glucitol operon
MAQFTSLIVAIVAGWAVQLVLAYRQSMAFNTTVRAMRTRGVVSVGVGGRRYRGGRQYVALAVDPDTATVQDAVTLRGFTTFARARALPALVGLRVNVVRGERAIPHLSRQQREAARQAAELWKAGTSTAVRESVP